MAERFYDPWCGSEYAKTKTLLLSESAYSWDGEEGEIKHPSRNHAKETVEWAIKELADNRYVRLMTRAICGKTDPSLEERQLAWGQYAYSIYIPGTVGKGPGGVRTPEMWEAGAPQFIGLVNDLAVEKVIITGKTIWRNMPDCDVYLTDDLQAYRRRGGQLTWCLAVPHPANRYQGFDWQVVGDQIRYFRATTFPST
jgi:hypothetical protein